MLRRKLIAVAMVTAVLPLILLHAQSKEETSTVKVEASKTEAPKSQEFKPEQQQTKGSVTIGGPGLQILLGVVS